jgi:DNA-binding NarL/FixJ family response regulator
MAGLTGRQQDVLRLLVDGRSTKEIARRLNLGLGTVKVHLNGVYQRLGARNRTEAVACFRARQLAGG